ncbi:uncharacterized protein BO80DRAFT_443382 [Aspergillus ibericus CBS 121593]|uniref:Fungal-type protein kinase domain-containing protein n=1 Tax=Aspergillus ibericus CBS 121593 TaxID=1448316 RepID=A0A395H4M6_9EURO|nr:hypothetical protein BO80DRAFT_443382 [Aspergillus ibericus CBS 121593]RAL02583.1 hypothetical protein BO80DRAFT_443382 [Aspergillus ibericus CBS 121593]
MSKPSYLSTAVTGVTNAVSLIHASALPSNLSNSAQTALEAVGLYRTGNASDLHCGDIKDIFGFDFVDVGNLWDDEQDGKPEGLTRELIDRATKWPRTIPARRLVSIILNELLKSVTEVHGMEKLRLSQTVRIRRMTLHGMSVREIHGLIDFSLWYGDMDKMETNFIVRLCDNVRASELLAYMGLLQRDQDRLQTKGRGSLYGLVTDGKQFHFYRLDLENEVRFLKLTWDGSVPQVTWILGVIFRIMESAGELSIPCI